MNDENSFDDAQALVQPGDTIIWQNGTYDDLDTLTFEPATNGTAVAPITLRAETPGGVIFRGSTRLQFGGSHLVISGFRFDNSDFTFPDDDSAGWVIQSRAHSDLARHATNCRVTDCAIINYDNPISTSSSKWIQWYGETNRFDHNFVSGKRSRGATFIVELNPNSVGSEAHHTIDNNVFADRPPDPAGANEFETIRTGTSSFSTQNAHISVDSNYFYRCSGEAEVVSNKSAENTYRYNTFIACAGSLTLRHGRGCWVEGNVFFGGNVPDSGGIRVGNQDHVIINNYMQDLAGTTYQAALAIMNGTTWTPGTSSPDLGGGYVQVKNCVIAHNTIINAVEPVSFGVGNGSSGRNTEPADNAFAANIVVSTHAPLFTFYDTPQNTTYLSNLVFGATVGLTDPNVVVADPLLTADAQGVQRPSAAGPTAGNAATELLIPGNLWDMDGAVRPLMGRDIGSDQIASGTMPVAPMAITHVGPVWIQSAAPPVVTSDPQDRTNAVGTTVSLAVSATGGVPLFYQWRHNGTNLVEGGSVSGSDERTLFIANAQTSDAGNYDVVISNGSGLTTSAMAEVTMFVITFPPFITSQPTNQVVATGGNASFTVGAGGTAPLSYQWYFDTTNLLAGATNATLNLLAVDADDEGGYHVVVSNADGPPATSATATLLVIPPDQPPTITDEPGNLTVTEGQTAEFTVTAIGTAPLHYQWYYQTNIVLTGKTSPTLTIPSAQATNAGVYSVVVTNNYGSDTSAFATLAVNPPGPAHSYRWDASTGSAGVQDGTGSWSTNHANWLLDGMAPNVVWDNNGPNDAAFGGGTSGTAGNVKVLDGKTITVRDITFNPPSGGAYTVDATTPTTSVLNFSGTPTVTVANGITATLKIILSGTGFVKNGAGTLTLGGGTGSFNTYNGLVTVNGGTLRLQKGSDNTECITAGGVRVNAGGTLQLPKKGHINDAATVTCAGGIVELVSSGGETFASLVMEGGVVTNSDTGTSRTLIMTTSIDVESGRIDGNAVKNIVLDGPASLTKTTGGTVELGAAVDCRYTGLTTVNGGTLMVNGIISASNVAVGNGGTLAGAGTVENGVTVQSGGTLLPGASIGTFTVGDLSLAAGSLTMVDVNAAASTSDRVTGFSSATYAGDLHVHNLAGTLAEGQTYQIFDAGGTGDFASITPAPGAGLAWDFDAASGVLSVVGAVNTAPPQIQAVLSNGNVNVWWPVDRTGWQLQFQTHLIDTGLWPAWPGSTTTNEVDVPIDPANTNFFLRLVYPPQP